MIHEIARAYHCPVWIATKVYFRDNKAYRNIHSLGPMRIYWKACHGWQLDNRSISVDALERLNLMRLV